MTRHNCATLKRRQRDRVVKGMDSKSIGLCPQGFESPRCRFVAGARSTIATCDLTKGRGVADNSRSESGWCTDGTSTPGAWRHAGVRFLLSGVGYCKHTRTHNWQMHMSNVALRQPGDKTPIVYQQRAGANFNMAACARPGPRNKTKQTHIARTQCARRESNRGHKHGRLV